jgi:hypothetical protein
MVVHACNNSYVVGRDWEDHGLKPAQAKKKIMRPPSQSASQVWWYCDCDSSYREGHEWKDYGLRLAPGKNMRHQLKIK